MNSLGTFFWGHFSVQSPQPVHLVSSTNRAFDYQQKDELLEREYGAIVAATGFEPISMYKFDEFAYSQSPDVVTSLRSPG